MHKSGGAQPIHAHVRQRTAYTCTRQEELIRHCEAPDSASNRKFSARESHAPVLVNTQSGYAGNNARARTQLHSSVWKEFDRVANAHHRMFEALGLPQVG